MLETVQKMERYNIRNPFKIFHFWHHFKQNYILRLKSAILSMHKRLWTTLGWGHIGDVIPPPGGHLGALYEPPGPGQRGGLDYYGTKTVLWTLIQ